MVMAGSIWSLIVGCIAGLLILWLTSQAQQKPAMAYRALGGICLALVGFWLYRISEVEAGNKLLLAAHEPVKSLMMPRGNLLLAVLVFLCLGAGHMMKTRQRHD